MIPGHGSQREGAVLAHEQVRSVNTSQATLAGIIPYSIDEAQFS